MRKNILLTLLFSFYSSNAFTNSPNLLAEASADSLLRDKQWIHGTEDCEVGDNPAIEVHRYDDASYILRQSKCLNFETCL